MEVSHFEYKGLMYSFCVVAFALLLPSLNPFKSKKEDEGEENMLSYLGKDKRKEMDFLIERMKEEGLDLENCSFDGIFFQLMRTSTTVNELKEEINSQLVQISKLKNELNCMNQRSKAELSLRQSIENDKKLYDEQVTKNDEIIKQKKQEIKKLKAILKDLKKVSNKVVPIESKFKNDKTPHIKVTTSIKKYNEGSSDDEYSTSSLL